jgi:hypothetical protein
VYRVLLIISDMSDFERLIFISLLGIQYHPRNDITPEDDDAVIARCIAVTKKAFFAYEVSYEND